MEFNLIPIPIGYDLGEADCSRVGYRVPSHTQVDGTSCKNGRGLLVVRENELNIVQGQGGGGIWICNGCSQTFSVGMTLNSPDDIISH